MTVRPAAHPRLVLAALASCGVLVSVMQTIVVPLLPELPSLTNSRPADVSWLVTITLLTGAVFTPLLGRACRHVRQAPGADRRARVDGARFVALRNQFPAAGADRGPRLPGSGGRRRPARHQYPARRVAAGPGDPVHRDHEFHPGRRRRVRYPRRDAGGAVRELAHDVLDLPRARPARHPAGAADRARVEAAHQRAVRRTGCSRAERVPGLPAAGGVQGERLGLGVGGDARVVQPARS